MTALLQESDFQRGPKKKIFNKNDENTLVTCKEEASWIAMIPCFFLFHTIYGGRVEKQAFFNKKIPTIRGQRNEG